MEIQSKQKRHRRTKAEMELVREIAVNDQPKQKRHRRTKAEMELVREIVCEIDDQPKQKRHRRTKAEMKLVREIEDVKVNKTDELNIEYKSKKIKHSNELVKLKFDHNGIPKDTILEVIDTPQNQIDDEFYIWIKYKETVHRILKFYVFFVR
jgi:hypothetical protein